MFRKYNPLALPTSTFIFVLIIVDQKGDLYFMIR